MKKIWIAGLFEEKNILAAFQWRAAAGGETEIAVAASGTFQVFAGGRLIGTGPRRSAKGRSIVNRYRAELRPGDMVTVLVASYRNNSFYLVNEPPFFACEVRVAGQVFDSDQFTARRVGQKVQKLVRYSFQRNFAECYRWSCDPLALWTDGIPGDPLPTEEAPGNLLEESELPYASLDRLLPSAVLEMGEVKKRTEYSSDDVNVQLSQGIVFSPEEYEVDLVDELYRMGFTPGGNQGETLTDGYRLYDFAENRTGYLSLHVTAESDCELFLIFDEILCRELAETGQHADYFAGGGLPLAFFRMGTVNAVKYELKRGEYRLLTLEPYTLRYLKMCAFGSCRIGEVSMRLYENPEARRINFATSDQVLQKVFEAAQNTFAQNAVDVLTDCPSRERAGWLCDSYFSGQAELLFTGKNAVERNFLHCLNVFPRIPELPEEVLPMCYPADHDDGNYIPNWAMWYVLELEDYVRRTGDQAMADAARARVYRLAEYFLKNYANEDGLLEKLNRWVFVEWSRSNELTMDVNYPTNMLFARMCRAIGSLYGDEKYIDLFESLRKKIIEQSWNGSFFEDRRLRKNGVLVSDGEATETCQYYAFYMDIATPEEFPELYERMFTEFGPNRPDDCWPEVARSNAFVGNFLRLDYLFRVGRVAQAVAECRDYFGFMADRTMTLWENDSPCASCNHGFASYAANMIVAAVTGYLGFDPVRRVIRLMQPAISTEFSVRIPVGSGFVCLSSSGSLSLPDGFTVERV